MTTQTSLAPPSRDGETSHSAQVQAGMVGGLMAAIFAISHASLVTGAAAPEAISTVMGMALIGSATLCILTGLFGRIPGAISMSQDVPSAALGAIVAALVTGQAAQDGGFGVAEIVVLNIFACLIFAATLILFGYFRLSMIMRYAPRPVVAGFLAGTGYFVAIGALGICLGSNVSWDTLPAFLGGAAREKLICALLVALALSIASRLLPRTLFMGLTMALAVLAVHVLAWVLGWDMAALGDEGWFAVFPERGVSWPPLRLDELGGVDLGFLAGQAMPLATMVVLSITALLMMVSAIETTARLDLDLDRELKTIGFSNLAAGVLGGIPGYPGAACTLAAHSIAPGHRNMSLYAGALIFAVFLFGNALLSILPLPVFAGFLLWVGGSFLKDWLFREMQRNTPGEAALTAAIFAVIVWLGLFEGTLFGLAAGGLLFIVDYSRQDPVRGVLTGDVLHSSAEFSAEELRVLRSQGGEIAILKLQGYVFFGTAYRIRDQIRALLHAGEVRQLILDFEAVTGLDATAVASFRRIAGDVSDAGAEVSFAALNGRVRSVFERAQFGLGAGEDVATAADLDSALARAERALLDRHALPAPSRAPDLQALLAGIFRDDDLAARIAGYLEMRSLAPGDTLTEEGEAAADIYFIEAGRLEVLVGAEAGTRRIRTIGAGAMIGEMAYYTGGTRSTTVRATEPSTLWLFSSRTADRILAEDPALSSRFHAAVAAILAERVTATTRLVQMLRS